MLRATLLVSLLVLSCWALAVTSTSNAHSHSHSQSNTHLSRLRFKISKDAAMMGTELGTDLGTQTQLSDLGTQADAPAAPALPSTSAADSASASASASASMPSSMSLVSSAGSAGSAGSPPLPDSTSSSALSAGESAFPASAMSLSSGSEASESSGFVAASLVPKDNNLYPAKIVGQLSPSSKRFARLDVGEESGDETSENSLDNGDPELSRLRSNLKAVQDSMVTGRRWVDVVRGVIAHYKEKVAKVEYDLKQEAVQAYQLKAAIVARHKALAKSRLQAQLDKVVAALRQLQDQTSTVSSKKQDLESMKRELMANIASIQTQIAGLHESSAPVTVVAQSVTAN